MIYYKKINLKCLSKLQGYLFNYINSSLQSLEILEVSAPMVVLPDELLNLVNSELNLYKIPDIDYCRIYLWPKGSVQPVHIDGSTTILHCAINIPLYGGDHSKFQWYDGSFELVSVNLIKTNQVAYYIKWHTPPRIADSIEIKDGCYLVRIDKPHQAIASANSDRWVFTMRFKDNPTFEDLYDKLSTSTL
jgi:hypothetical protein